MGDENTSNDLFGEPREHRGAGKEFLVVGLGASAGGVNALKEFFAHVPVDSDMAYVVILHLSPDHESHLAEVLQYTAAIPVVQVRDRVRVEPNHVYVISPNRSLTMADGSLSLSEVTRIKERRAPVDIFFRTLAESHHLRAVCVVLSGTGADGSMGMKRVKEFGGICIVQEPTEADYDDMPRNSIATGLVDFILPVAQIPAQIFAYRDHLGTFNIRAEPRPDADEQALRSIFTNLRIRTGHDFANYKRSTVLRRIERRISVHELPDLPAYADYLREQPDEARALLKDLLISVTNFFRDSNAFRALEQKIIPRLFQNRGAEEQIRVWVPGCATGEEAYSIAMLLAEATSSVDSPSLQVFASDIDDQAISKARNGLYTLKSRLRANNEQHELQQEELKASNEELQAMNEELRSSTEELETSKEELQSVNEELTTVNQELKVKIEELSQANNDFQNLMNSTDIGTIFLDRSMRVKLFTSRAREIFNLIPADLGRLLSDISNKLGDGQLLSDIEHVLETLQTVDREVRAGGEHWYLMRLLPYRTDDDHISGVVLTFTDISESKRAEEELRVAHELLEVRVETRTRELEESNESLRHEIIERQQSEELRSKLLGKLVRAQEEERQRIARDLHDQLGQQITALRLKLETLKERLRNEERAATPIQEIEAIAKQIESDVDFLAWEMRPSALDDLGLATALEDYVQRWTKHLDIPAHFHSTGLLQDERLSPEIKTNLYRITQEALNNIYKHAQANRVDVILERNDSDVVLIVEDDGAGFEPSATHNAGHPLGVIGMRERAALMGGTLEIESAAGKGTTIFVRIPIAPTEERTT